MKRSKTILLSLALPLILVANAEAQFAINWFSIDGGGGISTGNGYQVSGTIGQPDAGVQSGGGYVLSGGFWAGLTETPRVPDLEITRDAATGTVRVSWTDAGSGWALQGSTSPHTLVPGTWTTIAGPYPLDGNARYYEIVNPSGQRFFRLRKP